MGSPKSVMQRLKHFEDEGYAIEVRVLAISRRRSWLNVLRRYEDEKSRRGAGRMTPREVHDEAHDGLVKSIEQLASQSDVRLRVYSRDKEVFDSNANPNRPDAPHVLTAERNRPWTPAEKDTYSDDVKQLVTRAQTRNADVATIDEYQSLSSARRP